MRQKGVLKKTFLRYDIRSYSVIYSSLEQPFKRTHSNDCTILEENKI